MHPEPSVALIQALAAIWRRIRELHSEVPEVVLVPAPAPHGKPSVLGHFSALRWSAMEGKGAHLHEVVVVAEHLDKPVEETLDTLLHEAAHALNHERGIHDCSRSQYHNRAFKTAAEELGLAVKQVPHYGFADTRLPPETAALYGPQTEALAAVLIHRRKLAGQGGAGPTPTGGTTPTEPEGPSSSRSRKATCGCGYIIRVAKKTIEDTTIRCESCGEPFRLV